jgi:hypothetical protein
LAFVRNFIKIFLITSGYGQTDSEASELFPKLHIALFVGCNMTRQSHATKNVFELSICKINYTMTKIICILILIVGIAFISCKKDSTETNDCFPNSTTARQIVNKPATVKQQAGGLFYIIEHGTIDTKLNPCNLATEFKVNNLQVTISGDVKVTVQGGPGPCCTDDFVIKKITR